MVRPASRPVVATVILALTASRASAQADDTTAADGTDDTTDPATTPQQETAGGLTNVTSLVGTWSSGSGAVETGLKFFNPVTKEFTLPSNTGVSYSFTHDGFFETAKYRFESNAKTNRCFKASLVWQHGTYTLHPNGSITLQPFGPDGYIQVLDPCGAVTSKIYNYDEFELIPQWYNYLDSHPAFNSDGTAEYALELYQFDGQKMPLMELKYRPPQMLPTEQLFQKVLNG